MSASIYSFMKKTIVIYLSLLLFSSLQIIQAQHQVKIKELEKKVHDAKKSADKHILYQSYYSLALIYYEQRNYDKAGQYFVKAAKNAELVKNNPLAIDAYIKAGSAYANIEEYKESILPLEKALSLATIQKDESSQLLCYSLLAQYYSQLDNTVKSNEYLAHYNKIIQNTENATLASQKISDLKNKVEKVVEEKKHTEYELKKKSNTLVQVQGHLEEEVEIVKKSQMEIDLLNKDKELAEAKAKANAKDEEAELKNEALWRNFIIVFFLLAGALVTVLFVDNRKKIQTNKQIALQNEKITSSITYAKYIQEAMLPKRDSSVALLNNSFILFKPRDIVSGDFYWFTEIKNEASREKDVVFAAVDCTGHGVPAAFMSMIGMNCLSGIVGRGTTETNEILSELHSEIRTALRQPETGNNDGMDIGICIFRKAKKILEFSGGKQPLIYVQNNEIVQIKGDIHPIGGSSSKPKIAFTKHEIKIDKPTMIYMFSDGYRDQFGGPENRKFLSGKFRKLLHEIHTLPLEEQKEILNKTLSEWQGTNEQTDDILVMGIRIDA